jgi:hypothetical protein
MKLKEKKTKKESTEKKKKKKKITPLFKHGWQCGVTMFLKEIIFKKIIFFIILMY